MKLYHRLSNPVDTILHLCLFPFNSRSFDVVITGNYLSRFQAAEVLLERLSARSNTTTRYHSTEIQCALLGRSGKKSVELKQRPVGPRRDHRHMECIWHHVV